jgi:hypothetical protein
MSKKHKIKKKVNKIDLVNPNIKATQANSGYSKLANFKNKDQLLSYIGLGIILLLIILIRINFLTIPFERDEGAYAYSGKIILDGAKTFIDIGSQRLDGVFYAYSFLIFLFGYSVKALHIAFLFVNLGSATMLYVLMKKFTNNLTGIATSAFFAVLSMTPNASGFTIQSEHLVAFSVIGAFLSLIYFFDSKKIWQLVIAGILFSIAFQIKQTSFFYGLFAGLLILFKGFFVDKYSFRKNIFTILIFSFSVLLPIFFDLLIIYKNGAWSDFKLWFFDIRNQYSSIISFSDGLKYLKGSFNSIYEYYNFFWIISFLGTVVVFFSSMPVWKKITIAGLNIAGFLTIVPGNHYYGHYFLQWIPAVSICGAIFIYTIQDLLKKWFRLNLLPVFISIAIIILSVASNLNSLKTYYFNPDHTQILRAVYGLNPFPESKVIADKLNSMMKPEDQIAVFGTEIQMYVYTNRKSPSRFAGSGALLEFPVKQSNDWQKEFISDVEKANPRFLVFFSHPISWMANPKTENLIFPWFDKFSSEKYKLIGYADMYDSNTNYVWEPNPDLINKPAKSNYKIYIFERK